MNSTMAVAGHQAITGHLQALDQDQLFVNVEGRDAVAIELDVPLAGLKPGQYICQLNVIDDAQGSFAFPRFAVLVREPVAAAPPAVTPPAIVPQPTPASTSGSGGAPQ